MAIVSTSKLLDKAISNQYAVGAFNVCNLETVKAVLRAAEKLKSPAIIQLWSGFLKNDSNLALTVADIIRNECANMTVDVSIHLDHGESLGEIEQAIEAKYSSVMIDASSYDYQKNIMLTKEVVDIAHKKKIEVESELGHVAGGEGGTKSSNSGNLTDPKSVREFVQATNTDFLAIAVGTAHGLYKDTPKLDFKRIEKIREVTSAGLVLHGASYTPDDHIKKAILSGITKINVATELNEAYQEGIKEYLLEENKVIWPLDLAEKGARKMQLVVEKKMDLFGSIGKSE